MKICLAIAPPEAGPASFVVFRDQIEVSVEKVRRLGYDGIELALALPTEIDVRSMRPLLSSTGMELVAVSTGRVFSEQRVWLTHPEQSARRRAIDIMFGMIDLAAELNVRRVNVGRIRGGVAKGRSLDVSEARFFDAMWQCADHARDSGVGVMLEPVNRYEINYINSVLPDGIDVVRRLCKPNIQLMPDLFHMNIEDVSISDSLIAAGPMVGYVHLADSNRRAPGQGHTDFVAAIEALATIGYDDAVTVEILPHPSADEAAKEAIEFLRSLIEST